VPQQSLAESPPATAPAARRTVSPVPPVLTAAAALVAVQLGFRAWALAGGWFYVDDFRLLYEASTHALTPSSLFEPYDSQLMPLGRLMAEAVNAAGPLNWDAVVALSVALQALAGAACVWMLVTLFGVRWGILPPLCVYLFSVLTLPALLWWAASLNQLPLQAVTFAAVGLWVRHLRAPSALTLAGVVAVIGIGLLAYVKALLLLPLLLAIELLYFTEGTWRDRVSQLAGRRGRAGVLALVALGVGYIGYYLVNVPQIFTDTSWSVAGGLLWTMLGVAFSTAAVGGPWSWRSAVPPTSFADPPAWALAVAWVAGAAVVVTSVVLRRRSGRAWVLLAGYLVAVWLLAATSRAPVVGADIGLEYRYLTDTAGVLCLVLGLAFLDLLGAPGSSVRRDAPPGRVLSRLAPLLRANAVPVVATAVLVMSTSGLVSSWEHARTWQDENPAEDYVKTAMGDLAAKRRRIPLVDEVVPASVMPGWLFPYNTTSRMLGLVPQPTSFPETTTELYAVNEEGQVRQALIDVHVRSAPGPSPGCGWRVEAPGATVPMSGQVVDLSPWVRVGYLSSAPTPVTISMGTASVQTVLRPGAQSLFLRNHGTFDAVSFSGLDEAAAVCVEEIQAGKAVPGLVP
jgi:hypothetical protein